MRKKIINTAIVFIAVVVSGLGFGKDKSPLSAVDSVVWVGIDFSLVKMVGPDFNKPDEIFPGMLDKWNNLFVKERLKKISSEIDKEIEVDIEGVFEVNKKASKAQIKPFPGPDDSIKKSNISNEAIVKQVKGYALKSKNGIGLVFIADCFNKLEKAGSIYVVYFDIASRDVISSKRQVNGAGGFGFRNFWFRTIKDASVKP